MAKIYSFFLAAGIATLAALSASAAHIPPSDGFYYLPGTNGTAIVVYATGNEPEALYSLELYPGVQGIRRISTPWPLLMAKAIFSLLVYFWNLKDSGKSMFPEMLVFTVKYLVNFVPILGSVIFMFLDLAHGGKVPSYGVQATLLNMLILEYPCEETSTTNESESIVKKKYVSLYYAAAGVVILGMALFIIVGLVALAHGGLDSASSIAIAVDQSCVLGNGSFADCAHVGPYSFSAMTDGDGTKLVSGSPAPSPV